MNIYHAWCDLNPGVSDIAFSEGASKYSPIFMKKE